MELHLGAGIRIFHIISYAPPSPIKKAAWHVAENRVNEGNNYKEFIIEYCIFFLKNYYHGNS